LTQAVSASAEVQDPADDFAQLRKRVLESSATPEYDDIAAFASACLQAVIADPAHIDAARLSDGRAAWARSDQPTEYGLGYETDVASALFEIGQHDSAAVALSSGLEHFSGAQFMLPRALNVLADIERSRERWDESLARLAACERSLRAESASNQFTERCKFHCIAAQLALDMGLPDRVQAELDQARAAQELIESGSPERASFEFATWRITISLWATTDRQAQIVEQLTKRLGEADSAKWTAAERALAKVLLGATLCNPALDPAAAKRKREIDGTVFDDGVDLLCATLKDSAADSEARAIAQQALVETYLDRGDFDRAQAALSALSSADPESPRTCAAWRQRALCAAFDLRLARARKEAKLEPRVAALELAAQSWLKGLHELPPRPGGLGLLHYTDHRTILIELLRGRCLDVGGADSDARAWQSLMAFQSLGSLTRLCKADACDLARFRRDYLGSDEGVLVFIPGHPNSLALAIDREHFVCDLIAAEDRIDVARRSLTPMLSIAPAQDAPTAALTGARSRLSELLFGKGVRERLEHWNRVAILGAELHENVPFECLPWKGVESLGLAKAVSTLPSAPLGLLLRDRFRDRVASQPSEGDVLVLAAPTAATGLEALSPIPWSKQRTQNWQNLYPAGVLELRTGPLANIDALRSERARGSKIWQLTVHGEFALQRERPAHLRLAPTENSDGRLWCEIVDGLGGGGIALHAPRVVILASCGAARDQKRFGEDGVSNLGGAFLLAGAQCVLIARYDVDLEAVERMTLAFHRRLIAGDVPAEALRRSRAELASDPLFAHPYYWNSLTLFGDGWTPIFR
jgi:tetratricopeptide (TPR) repeat protein